MPAIDPEQLRKQSEGLVELFPTQEAFVRELHNLLDYYADRTRRPGETGTPPPLIHSYRVPPPVLRQVQRDLAEKSSKDPPASLVLADALWLEDNLECRTLAINLLNWIPGSLHQEVRERVYAWADPMEEGLLLDLLLTDGIKSHRQEAPTQLLRQIRAWLTEPDVGRQSLGLRAIKPFAMDPEYKNLPQIYSLLKSPCQTAPPELRPYLLNLLEALAERSPKETALFLRECLLGATGRGSTALVRAIAPRFPPDLQASLLSATREKDRAS